LVVGPGRLQGVDIFIDDVVASLEINTQRCVLTFQVAGTQAEGNTPSGDDIECGHGACRDERVAVVQYQDASLQPELFRNRGERGKGHERIVWVVTAVVEPAARRAGVVGYIAPIESGTLQDRADPGHRLRRDELRWIRGIVEGQCYVDLHLILP